MWHDVAEGKDERINKINDRTQSDPFYLFVSVFAFSAYEMIQ